jgi:hypothetical protein
LLAVGPAAGGLFSLGPPTQNLVHRLSANSKGRRPAQLDSRSGSGNRSAPGEAELTARSGRAARIGAQLAVGHHELVRELPACQQTVILESSRKVERALREEMADIEAKAYEFARAKGMRINELAPNDVAEWRACSAGVVEDYMNGAGELASLLMSSYGRLRIHPCCSSGPKGTFSLR